MKTVQLRDLVTEDQLKEIILIIAEPDYTTRMKNLRAYLITQRDSLEPKGVMPEYLAYVIEFNQQKALAQFEAEERKNAKNN